MKIAEEDKLLMQQTTLEDGTNAWDHVQSWSKEDDRPWIVRGIKSCMEKGYHLNVMMIGWETRNIRSQK